MYLRLFKGSSTTCSALLGALALTGLAGALLPAAVFAEATVSVSLKDPQGQPADGKVTLSSAEGKSVATCVAHAGQCEMQSVPGGFYTVTVEPAKGAAPKPRKVMIPPSGKVALVVATR
jgi:hypothetical protein